MSRAISTEHYTKENTMSATDNLKALAKRSGSSVSALRGQARDLGLVVNYSKSRHTWFLDEPATTVRAFNEFVNDRTA